ncbi:MAG TPA: PrsW family intramembrane metalloprotease [Kofleriaceae bacterium]
MDQHLEVALSGAIPALIAMWLVDRLDAKRPEPLRLRWGVTVVGMVMVLPAIVIELTLMRHVGPSLAPAYTYQYASFNAFVVAAAVEEACKILVVYFIVWGRPEFDERMDGIVYAARAGLGFALVENVMYLVNAPDMHGQILMWIERALLAVPGHAMWTGMIGASAARWRFDRRGLGLVGGYLLAVAFHGAYDCSVFVRQPLNIEGRDLVSTVMIAAPIVLTILAFLVLRAMARTALRLDDADAARAAAAAAAARGVSA